MVLTFISVELSQEWYQVFISYAIKHITLIDTHLLGKGNWLHEVLTWAWSTVDFGTVITPIKYLLSLTSDDQTICKMNAY